MTCKHCGEQIKSYNNYRGETDWTHVDQMVGRWCWLKTATPEES